MSSHALLLSMCSDKKDLYSKQYSYVAIVSHKVRTLPSAHLLYASDYLLCTDWRCLYIDLNAVYTIHCTARATEDNSLAFVCCKNTPYIHPPPLELSSYMSWYALTVNESEKLSLYNITCTLIWQQLVSWQGGVIVHEQKSIFQNDLT